MVKPFSFGSFVTTNAFLSPDGNQRISQLCKNHTQEIQFIHRTVTSNGIGQGRDRRGQLTGIHRSITPNPSYAAGANMGTNKDPMRSFAHGVLVCF